MNSSSAVFSYLRHCHAGGARLVANSEHEPYCSLYILKYKVFLRAVENKVLVLYC